MTDPVRLDRQGPVAYLTLDRPGTGNAVDISLARGLLDATQAVEADSSIRCLVLRGNGRMFCVGGDLNRLQAAGDALPDLLEGILGYLNPAIVRLARMDKPVITAVQGPSAGAGVGLALVGDIVLAEPAAHFTMAYSRIGLSPDGGSTWLLPRLIGLRRAQELFLTHRRVSAEEALTMGLITRVVDEGTLAREVDALAEALARSATGALARTKRLLLSGSQAALEEQLDAEREHIVEQANTVESRIGITAFAERRESSFPDSQDASQAAPFGSWLRRSAARDKI